MFYICSKTVWVGAASYLRNVARSVGYTRMNDQSSRSHCIFYVGIKKAAQKDKNIYAHRFP